ncbi:hypothetical protein OG331_19305 [Streptomyces sp. NBC_01017]|nr:hypothetical protein OG331_19305 [Streptomyces sp. NBC_01017]
MGAGSVVAAHLVAERVGSAEPAAVILPGTPDAREPESPDMAAAGADARQ